MASRTPFFVAHLFVCPLPNVLFFCCTSLSFCFILYLWMSKLYLSHQTRQSVDANVKESRIIACCPSWFNCGLKLQNFLILYTPFAPCWALYHCFYLLGYSCYQLNWVLLVLPLISHISWMNLLLFFSLAVHLKNFTCSKLGPNESLEIMMPVI